MKIQRKKAKSAKFNLDNKNIYILPIQATSKPLKISTILTKKVVITLEYQYDPQHSVFATEGIPKIYLIKNSY